MANTQKHFKLYENFVPISSVTLLLSKWIWAENLMNLRYAAD